MARLRLIPALVVLLSACPAPDDSGDDDTAANESTSESAATTDTSAGDASTASIPMGPFGEDIWPIISANCSCHTTAPADGTPGAVGDPFLSSDPTTAYSVLVDQPSTVPGFDYIEPGSSANSYLYLKITDAFVEVGGFGTIMPPGTELSADDVATIEVWIDAGAPF